MSLSVIIPIGKCDQAWRSLLPDLKFLETQDEIILVSPDPECESFRNIINEQKIGSQTKWIQSSCGRAKQMNAGAKIARQESLWFLHCDSRISPDGIRALKNTCKDRPSDLLFFNLDFIDDGPKLMRFNQIGVWLRSRLLRLPFGDQGFCLSKKTFKKLGGFNETVHYGEDHLLIWSAHRKKISIFCIGESLKTSSRRYNEFGWLQTTSKHVMLTIGQALPQFIQMIRERRGGLG